MIPEPEPQKKNKRYLGMTGVQLALLGGMAALTLSILILALVILTRPAPGAPAAAAQSTAMPASAPASEPTAQSEEPTRAPTNTPRPTSTSRPTNTPRPTSTPVQPTATPEPIGVLLVDSWRFEITEVHSDPGLDSGRQVIVLLGNLTNEGRGTDTFTALYTVVLQDSQGRQYEEDQVAGYAAEDRYQTEIPASIAPGATKFISIAYDVPATERSFRLVPGSLTSSWSGDIAFTLPQE